MKEISIANFKAGIDNRREQLVSVLGTLVSCTNAHINPGGEIEKRKAFVLVAGFDIKQSDNAAINAFYWIESTDAGLILIGSAAEVVGAVINGEPYVNGALPAGYSYQQLRHPSVTDGETYSNALHRISRVKFSKVFAGKAFVSVLFTDGNTFLYYDGEIVRQSSNGRVLTGLSDLSDLSTDLARQINGVTDWVALANVDQNGVTQNGTTIVKSPIDVTYTPIPSVSSDEGVLGSDIIDLEVPVTPEVKATASFQVTRVSDGTVEITAPDATDLTSSVNLTGGPVATAASDVLMAAKVAQAVNDLTVVHGYTAAVNAATISVYAPIGLGTSINTLLLTVNVTGGMGTAAPGSVPISLSATFSPNPASSIWQGTASSGSTKQVGIQISISVSGGTAPYTYLWSNISGMNSFGAATALLSLNKVLNKGEVLTRTVQCLVTDALAVTLTVFVNVRLEYKYP